MGNGVEEVGETFMTEFAMKWPNPGFDIVITDQQNPEKRSQRIHAVVGGDVDSSMPEGTLQEVMERIKNCDGPVETLKSRLFGLLGRTTVQRCGAFPDQNPKKIKVIAQDTGWFNSADFL